MSTEASDSPVKRFPRHDPKLEQASVQQAEEFYKWDKQLTVADRRKLSSYFWQKLAVFPLLGLPVVYGFIVAPNYLKKRGILDPKKRYRLLQFGLGFMGLGVGFQLSGAISSVIHMQLLKDNPPALNAYSSLRRYPPQLGIRYFGMTAKAPELAMKDPKTIDWKENPLFPIILVMNREVITKIRNIEKERADKYRAAHEQKVKQQIEQRSGRQGNSNSTELTGTSWDNVIQSQDQYDMQSPTENTTTSSKDPYSMSTSLNSYDTFDALKNPEISEEQRKFDEMLEKERQQSLEDDFSDTEKTWT